MKISAEEVVRIARLARLELAEDEIAKFGEQMGSILDYVSRLQAVDTDGVEPMQHVTPVSNVWGEDEAVAGTPAERTLAIAAFPDREGDLLKVKAVFGA
jgi:aspartyl-tRNA(Asn)/glutamyl-tRNA(Gln) amidotransferase subunit C